MMRTMIEGAKLSTRKVLGFVCAALLALAVGIGVQAVAADEAQAEPYKYTVTLYAGNGAIDGKDSVTIGTYTYGQQATVDWMDFDITLPDDKYYVKGVRLVGHDDSSVDAPSFAVKEDTQYVVAYGLKKDQTKYTVNYLDEAGNQLAPSQTFDGNIGDKPVVAYQYIEGYQPNAWNITGTLSGNTEANVFNFIYTAAPEGAAAAGFAGSDVAGTDDEGVEDGTGEEGAEGQAADEATGSEPAELIDIDDEENPLAGISAEDADGFSVVNVLPWVFGVLVVIALISVIALLVAKKRQARNTNV